MMIDQALLLRMWKELIGAGSSPDRRTVNEVRSAVLFSSADEDAPLRYSDAEAVLLEAYKRLGSFPEPNFT
jgi:hypothetical protein